jgi:hypothetical protein
MEIADSVGTVFENGGATRDEILAAALASRSRPEVTEVLTGLTVRRYSRLNEIWRDLAEVPVGA